MVTLSRRMVKVSYYDYGSQTFDAPHRSTGIILVANMVDPTRAAPINPSEESSRKSQYVAKYLSRSRP